MKTCCPQCDTVLTLTQQQVAQRNGMVRCGVCRHVFNALEHLYEEEDYPVLSEEQDTMYEETSRPSVVTQRSYRYDEEMPRQRSRFEEPTPTRQPLRTNNYPSETEPAIYRRETTQESGSILRGRNTREENLSPRESAYAYAEDTRRSSDEPRIRAYDDRDAYRPETARQPSIAPASAATPAVHIHLNTGTETRQSNEPRLFVDQQEQEDEHYIGARQGNHGERDFTIRSDATYEEEDYYDEPSRRSGFGMFWFILILVAILLIAGQIFYVFRNQISTSFPAMRPVLAQMCSLLKCEVGIQKSVDNLALENVLLSVDKNVLPKQGEHALRLQALLSNKTDQAQEWPVLILRLKNAQGVVMNSKNIQPKEYLAPEQVMKPFAANAKQAINLPFILDGEAVNGYELSIFYP